MAISSRASSIFSLKTTFISIAVLSAAVILSYYLPAISEFLLSEVPVIWSSIRSWLTPPYLYFIINCIIITIAASSRFQYKVEEHTEVAEVAVPVKIPADSVHEFNAPLVYVEDAVVLNAPADVGTEFGYNVKNAVVVGDELEVADVQVFDRFDYGVDVHIPAVVTPEFEVTEVEIYGERETRFLEVKSSAESLVSLEEEEEEEEEGDEDVISKVSLTEANRTDSMEILRTESMEFPTEYPYRNGKPLASSRFGRKIVKGNPEAGKALKVSKPKRQETLETTWKMITEGRSIPLARHLKKSDTWETHARPHTVEPAVKKADTFTDRTSTNNNSHQQQHQSPSLTRSSGSGKLKKDPSLGQEELNRKVEAFIKKMNEEMRLQRMESLMQYKQMTHGDRGGHF